MSTLPSALSSSTTPHRRARASVSLLLATALVATSLALVAAPAGSIVGGDFARITAHPHQVALVTPDGRQFCGGSIIGRSTIVTAAHCVEGLRTRGVLVQAGGAHLYRGKVQIRSVSRIIRHPRYGRDEVADVAVLHLRSPVRFNRKVRPIELASPADVAGATRAVVTGWGARFEQNQRGSLRLRRVVVPLVDDRTCNAAMREVRAAIVPGLELCAGTPGADTCYGDSGGPLVVRTPDGPRLAGITSWGMKPCGGPRPGVYTEVAALARWIERRSIG